ncbi:type II secretion system protein [bacterium]|nr:type II secretion system protein [bacterium]
MRNNRRRRAFTLIELMIAIAIIAILAAIAIPRFVTARYRAYLSACSVNEKNLATALESYRTDYRIYPPALITLVGAGGSGYIQSLPSCPSAPTTQYTYVPTPDGEGFTIGCPGYHQFQINGQLPGFPQYVAGFGLKENGP